MATITPVSNGDSALVARTAWNTNDTNVNAEVVVATADIVTLNVDVTALEDRFHKQTINLVANTNYPLSNPFSLPVIPNIVQVYTSAGVELPLTYKTINQSTGDITVNTGTTYNNAIITIIGW